MGFEGKKKNQMFLGTYEIFIMLMLSIVNYIQKVVSFIKIKLSMPESCKKICANWIRFVLTANTMTLSIRAFGLHQNKISTLNSLIGLLLTSS